MSISSPIDLVICGNSMTINHQLVRDIINRKDFSYSKVFFFQSESEQDLDFNFRQIHSCLELDACSDTKYLVTSKIVSDIYEYLDNCPTVFVFEGVEKYAVIKPYLPTLGKMNYSCIVTTRCNTIIGRKNVCKNMLMNIGDVLSILKAECRSDIVTMLEKSSITMLKKVIPWNDLNPRVLQLFIKLLNKQNFLELSELSDKFKECTNMRVIMQCTYQYMQQNKPDELALLKKILYLGANRVSQTILCILSNNREEDTLNHLQYLCEEHLLQNLQGCYYRIPNCIRFFLWENIKVNERVFEVNNLIQMYLLFCRKGYKVQEFLELDQLQNASFVVQFVLKYVQHDKANLGTIIEMLYYIIRGYRKCKNIDAALAFVYLATNNFRDFLESKYYMKIKVEEIKISLLQNNMHHASLCEKMLYKRAQLLMDKDLGSNILFELDALQFKRSMSRNDLKNAEICFSKLKTNQNAKQTLRKKLETWNVYLAIKLNEKNIKRYVPNIHALEYKNCNSMIFQEIKAAESIFTENPALMISFYNECLGGSEIVHWKNIRCLLLLVQTYQDLKLFKEAESCLKLTIDFLLKSKTTLHPCIHILQERRVEILLWEGDFTNAALTVSQHIAIMKKEFSEAYDAFEDHKMYKNWIRIQKEIEQLR